MVENTALALLHVCQQWANVVHVNNTLWKYIYVKSLAIQTWRQYTEFCLDKLGQNTFICLHLQTIIGTVSRAREFAGIFKDRSIDLLQIYVTQASAKAAEHLIGNLPGPTILRVCNPDAVEKSTSTLQAHPKSPKHLLIVTLEDRRLRASSTNKGSYSTVQELTIGFKWPTLITSSIAENFTGLSTIVIPGANPRKRKIEGRNECVFPHLQHLKGPLRGLVNAFDASCEMPVLSVLTIWIHDKKKPLAEDWKQLLDRDNLKMRLGLVEIPDMGPEDAAFIPRYMLEIPKLPRLTMMGRSVDVICQNLVSPATGARALALESVVVRSYAGDGSSILNLVRSCNGEANSSQAPEIKLVDWFDCDDVSLQMRRDVKRLTEGHSDQETVSVAVKAEDRALELYVT